MALYSTITTEYTPDVPRELTANYRMDRADRTFLDAQMLGVQRHLSDSLIRGQICSNYLVASTSPALAVGDVFCAAPSTVLDSPASGAIRKVTKATAAALSAAGIALGVAMAAAAPGTWVRGAMEGLVGPDTTGLATGSAGFVRVSSAGRAERVGALSTGDVPLGYVDGYGNLSLLRERGVSAGAGGGGYGTVQDEGTPLTARTVINFVGGGVTATDFGGVTTVTIPGGSGPSGSAVGQTQIWNGSAWTAGALDLADADARTGVLPIANGGTGLSSAGGTANRALVTTDGSTWAAGLIALTTMVSGLLPFANLADGSATSVFGRAGGTAGVQASIAATTDGQVLRRAGGSLAFGAVDLADTDAVTGLLPFANVANGSALSVLARAGNTAGVMASLAGTSDQVLRVNTAGTALAFGTIATAGYTDSSVTLAKLANGTASSVLGRSAATSGVYADIASSADGQVLRRGASGVIAFGSVDLADSDAVTGLLPFANVASLAGLSVLGRAANTSGVMAAITGADGQVLRVSGTTLAFGTIAPASIADGTLPLAKLVNATASSVLGRSAATSGVYADIASSADGQVLRRGASGVIAFGAVDLADSDAVTGILPFANQPDGSALSVLGRSANSAGVMAPIAGTASQVLSVNAGGTALAFSTLGTASYADGSVTLAKLPNATASSVLGRSAATGGVYADIASSADGQVLRRGASGVVAFGAVDLADSDAVTGFLPFANLPNGAATSVLGRSANSAGVLASISASADGQVLTRVGGVVAFAALGVSSLGGGSAVGQVLTNASGNVPTWGALDLADTDAVTGLLAFTNIASVSARSLLGRSANTSGVLAPIVGGGANTVLVDNGTALTFATLNLSSLTSIAGYSVVGNATAASAVPTAISGAADGQMLRRSGIAVGWGSIDLSVSAAVGTSKLNYANMVNVGALSVPGRSVNSSGVMADIQGSTNQVLRVDAAGTDLSFGAVNLASAAAVTGLLQLANLRGGSAVGQVLRNTSGNVPAWGAVDLADGDAVTGLLPVTNLANGVDGRVLVTVGGVAAWTSNIGNIADAFTYNAASHDVYVAGTRKLFISSTSLTLYQAPLQWADTLAGSIGINSSGAAVATGNLLTGYGQDMTGAGATVGGAMLWRAGNSTNGTGGALDLRSGAGPTAAGAFTARVGSTTFLSIPGNTPVATAGNLRFPTQSSLYARTFDGLNNVKIFDTSSGDGVFFGDTSFVQSMSMSTVGARLILGTNVEIQNASQLRFDSAITGGVNLIHEADGTASQATANKFSIGAQSRTGSGTTVGAELELASGTGATAGALTLKVGSTVMMSANDLGSSREVLGLFGSVNSTKMPALTGDSVLYWAEGSGPSSAGFTGAPVDGGIVWNDPQYGLQWKSKYNIETTIAPRGANATTKRRLVEWKSDVTIYQTITTATQTACSFDVSNFNGLPLGTGTIVVRGKCVSFGGSNDVAYAEVVAVFRVNSGVISSFGSAAGFYALGVPILGGGLTAAAIDFSGSVIRLRVAPFATGGQLMSHFEVHAAEVGN